MLGIQSWNPFAWLSGRSKAPATTTAATSPMSPTAQQYQSHDLPPFELIHRPMEDEIFQEQQRGSASVEEHWDPTGYDPAIEAAWDEFVLRVNRREATEPETDDPRWELYRRASRRYRDKDNQAVAERRAREEAEEQAPKIDRSSKAAGNTTRINPTAQVSQQQTVRQPSPTPTVAGTWTDAVLQLCSLISCVAPELRGQLSISEIEDTQPCLETFADVLRAVAVEAAGGENAQAVAVSLHLAFRSEAAGFPVPAAMIVKPLIHDAADAGELMGAMSEAGDFGRHVSSTLAVIAGETPISEVLAACHSTRSKAA